MDERVHGKEGKMRYLVIYAVFGTIFFFASCSSPIPKKTKDTPASFIENFIENGANLEKVKGTFGESNQKIKIKDIQETVYKYINKKHRGREWSFGIGKDKKLVWINYRPWGNSNLDRVEILPTTFKKYNCRKKREPDTRVAHVIRDYTFFECAKGKIRAYYNIHGEISSIAVSR